MQLASQVPVPGFLANCESSIRVTLESIRQSISIYRSVALFLMPSTHFGRALAVGSLRVEPDRLLQSVPVLECFMPFSSRELAPRSMIEEVSAVVAPGLQALQFAKYLARVLRDCRVRNEGRDAALQRSSHFLTTFMHCENAESALKAWRHGFEALRVGEGQLYLACAQSRLRRHRHSLRLAAVLLSQTTGTHRLAAQELVGPCGLLLAFSALDSSLDLDRESLERLVKAIEALLADPTGPIDVFEAVMAPLVAFHKSVMNRADGKFPSTEELKKLLRLGRLYQAVQCWPTLLADLRILLKGLQDSSSE